MARESGATRTAVRRRHQWPWVGDVLEGRGCPPVGLVESCRLRRCSPLARDRPSRASLLLAGVNLSALSRSEALDPDDERIRRDRFGQNLVEADLPKAVHLVRGDQPAESN